MVVKLGTLSNCLICKMEGQVAPYLYAVTPALVLSFALCLAQSWKALCGVHPGSSDMPQVQLACRQSSRKGGRRKTPTNALVAFPHPSAVGQDVFVMSLNGILSVPNPNHLR